MITQRYRRQNRIPVSNVPGSHRQPDKQKPCPEMIISFPSDQADQYTDTVYNYPASCRPEGSCHLSAESCKGCFLYDKPALPYPQSLEDNSFGTHPQKGLVLLHLFQPHPRESTRNTACSSFCTGRNHMRKIIPDANDKTFHPTHPGLHAASAMYGNDNYFFILLCIIR